MYLHTAFRESPILKCFGTHTQEWPSPINPPLKLAIRSKSSFVTTLITCKHDACAYITRLFQDPYPSLGL